MTLEEFGEVKMRMVSHLTLEKTYVSSYVTDIKGLYASKEVRRNHLGMPTGKTKIVYIYLGKEYRKVEDLLKAINENESQNCNK
jgi:hypothetical protein